MTISMKEQDQMPGEVSTTSFSQSFSFLTTNNPWATVLDRVNRGRGLCHKGKIRGTIQKEKNVLTSLTY